MVTLVIQVLSPILRAPIASDYCTLSMFYKQRLKATIFQPVQFLIKYKQQPIKIKNILSNSTHLFSEKNCEKSKLEIFMPNKLKEWNNTFAVDTNLIIY